MRSKKKILPPPASEAMKTPKYIFFSEEMLWSKDRKAIPMQQAAPTIIIKKIADLHFAYYNSRKISGEEFDELKKSLKGFGIVQPAVINKYPKRKNVIIAGEQRIKAAKKLGIKEFPCIEVSLPLEKEKELNIRLNKISGEWDFEILFENFHPEELKEFGFDVFEIEQKEAVIASRNDDKILMPSRKIGIRRGDIFDLNDHRLMCGDSAIKNDVDKLFGNRKAKLIFTSPPYNMKSNLYPNFKDNRKNDEFILFNFNVLLNWKRKLQSNGFVFWNMSYNVNSGGSFLEIFYYFIKNSGLIFLEDIVWDKGTGQALSDQLTRRYEHILVLNEGLENIRFIDHFGLFGMKRIPLVKETQKGITNYWRLDSFKAQTEKFKAAYPVALPMRAIELCTLKGEIVADCFAGTGTTFIAAEKTDRRALCMELDPEMCDVIIERYQNWCAENEVPCIINKNGKTIHSKNGTTRKKICHARTNCPAHT